MSRISDLGKNNSNVVNIIEEYEQDLVGYADNLQIKSKTLEYALREQAAWSAYYGERRTELKTIVNHFETQTSKCRSLLYVQYNENYNPALTDRAIEKYIDREPEYLTMWGLQAEFAEILDKYNMVLDAFNRRGFALRDITASRIAMIHDITL
jgi:hypothetical protein